MVVDSHNYAFLGRKESNWRSKTQIFISFSRLFLPADPPGSKGNYVR